MIAIITAVITWLGLRWITFCSPGNTATCLTSKPTGIGLPNQFAECPQNLKTCCQKWCKRLPNSWGLPGGRQNQLSISDQIWATEPFCVTGNPDKSNFTFAWREQLTTANHNGVSLLHKGELSISVIPATESEFNKILRNRVSTMSGLEKNTDF